MKRTKSLISFLLILSLLIPAIPSSAEEVKEIVTETISSTVAEESATVVPDPESAPTILYEDESLRGQYEKHFLMSDGTYQATVYNEPIHYKTASGWVEVDNTLNLRTTADGTIRYATADGLADVSFSQSTGDRLVTVSQGDYSLSWDVIAVSAGKRPVAAATAELAPVNRAAYSPEEQKAMALKSTSTLRYRNALGQDTDLEYIVLPSRVKENIILQSKQDISAYVITVHAENLIAQLQPNREILFLNKENEVVFTMTSPYMYDSAGELSEDIDVEMTTTARSVYTIRMTPDATWLSDTSRIYPVTIDPQVTTSSERTNIIDNYVLEGAGVQNRNLDRLYIGRKSGSRARAYIKFTNMPTIPTGSTITATTMTLHITANTSTGNTADAYIVNGGDWSSSTITWANMPSASGPVSVNISHNNLTRYSFPCNYAVRTWYSGSTTGQNKNYGIMIRYSNESIADYNAVYSADHTTANQRPSLVITYQLPSTAASIEEGTTYTLSSAGMSGIITWVSDNTTVATVDSSGKVTGIKAGKATITASVGGVVQKGFVVYVKIANGVYYIKNGGNLCLGTSGGITDGTTTSLFAVATSGRSQLNQLWKIAYLDSGYYSIRPLYKLDKGLYSADGSQGNVEIATIGTSDTFSNVPGIYRWTIEYNSSGYLFCCAGTKYLTMQSSMPYPGASVVTKTYSASGSGFMWTLEKAIGITNQVLLLDTLTGTSAENVIRYVEVGDTITLADMGIATSFVSAYSTDQSITWSTLNPSVVSVNSSTGAVTGLSSGGTATIKANHIYNGVAYAKHYKVHVICPDPLAPSKIQYMRQTRITGTNWIAPNIGTSTDCTITVIKSSCSSDVFFTAIDNINGQASRSYAINSELKDQLNALEAGYQDGFNILPGLDQSTDNEKAAHGAKGETDQLVQAGYFSTNSDEYYGVWAHNYMYECNLGDLWGSIIETTTQYYNIYLSVSAFYYSWLATTNTNSIYISASQYDDMAAYLDDIDDAANYMTFSQKTTISAEERNAYFIPQNYDPLPYQPGTPVVEGQISNFYSSTYVRVYSQGNNGPVGHWFMRYSDIQGLTPKQIQAKYALQWEPTHYCHVDLPVGTTVYAGMVNKSSTGAVQFEILGDLSSSWFSQGISWPW